MGSDIDFKADSKNAREWTSERDQLRLRRVSGAGMTDGSRRRLSEKLYAPSEISEARRARLTASYERPFEVRVLGIAICVGSPLYVE